MSAPRFDATELTALLDAMQRDDAEDLCPCGGPHCAVCGCCDHNPCPGGCIWATPTLCSRCVE